MVIGTVSLSGSRTECNGNELKCVIQLGGGMTLSITLMNRVPKLRLNFRNTVGHYFEYHPYTHSG